MTNSITLALVLAVILAFGSTSFAAIYYVSQNGSEDFTTIQGAIDSAGTVNGDTIIVRQGRYNEHVYLSEKRLTVQSTSPTNTTVVQATIIDGSGTESPLEFGPDTTAQTLVSGFTLENGRGPGGGIYCHAASPTITYCIIQNNTAGLNRGGGISITNGTATIKHCVIQNNTSQASGGGISIEGGMTTIQYCDFINNSADSIYEEEGGAIFLSSSAEVLLEHCSFKDNEADSGGAAYIENSAVATFNSCNFQNNYAKYHGGAVYATGLHSIYSSDPIQVKFFDCLFDGNHTTSSGGCIYNNDSDVAYVNCQFKNNYARNILSTMHLGGVMYNTSAYVTAINCIFLSNYAENTNYDSYGGAICNRSSSLTIKNCTFRYNHAIAGGVASMGGAIYNDSTRSVTIDNSIFRSNDNNSEGEIHNTYDSTKPTISYCNIYGSGGSGASWDDSLGIDGGGNIAAYPYFISTTDLRLMSHSPCIDAGNAMAAAMDITDIDNDGVTAEWIAIDLDKNERFVDKLSTADTGSSPHPDIEIIDMGAYEYQDSTSDADLNNDGSINNLDLLCFSDQWLISSCPNCLSADFNGDGDVNFEDYAILMKNW
jgi:predicted outer membrane repeat protein